jgi:parvulin-like peptidyl-prolyl isomerase
MDRPVCVTVLLAALLLLIGCKSNNAPTRPWDKPDSGSNASTHQPPPVASPAPASSDSVRSAVLRVGRETITVLDVLEPIRQKLEEEARQSPPAAYDRTMVRLVREQIRDLIQESLIYQEATKDFTEAQRTALDEVAEKAVNKRIQEEFGGVRARFEQYLAQFGKTIEDAKERERRRGIVLEHLRRQLLPRLHVTREELLQRYDRLCANAPEPRREMYLIEVPIPSREDWPSARRQIEEAAERLRAGESFDDVARTCSRGLHAADGGAWGLISKDSLAGKYARCEQALFELRPGQTSEIIETDGSFFLVRCASVEAIAQPTFVEMQPELEAQIKEDKLREASAALIEDLYRRAAVGDIEPFIAAVMSAAPQPSAPSAPAPGPR